jgi:ribosome biogenesis GTPase / thiamine phosphate phosphatase
MDDCEQLGEWGWDDRYAASFAAVTASPHAMPARVVGQDRDRWAIRVPADAGVVDAGVAASGAADAGAGSSEAGAGVARIASAAFPGVMPVTGDWVVVEPGPEAADPFTVVAVLPRRSAVSRGAAGTGAVEQVLAANVDVVWIVHGLDTPPNARRLERYLAVAWESGAVPEIILTKADLSSAPEEAAAMVESLAIGVAVHVVSAAHEDGVRALKALLRPGVTYALFGPSGAGKSTLINALAEHDVAATGEVRAADRKGRHTTTRRELFRIAGGALLLDTPGLREFRIWAVGDGLAHTFPDIEELATSCRYRDCRHVVEPGCAVIAAAEAGTLDAGRLASFRKLVAEAEYMERRHDPEANAAAVAKHRTALKTMKYHLKNRDPGADR